MDKALLSVGIDVGTTSTQMVVSRLVVENRASAFTVPEMEIQSRQVIYRSPVHFTPLLGQDRVDGQRLRQLVEAEYAAAGIRREDVDTGAVIVTGETSRKENARAVLDGLSAFSGEFVVATAGPELESRLAARGAGAVDWSARTGQRVLHMDIGGGTSNLAWIEDGAIVAVGCLNVGGRLIRYDRDGRITYVSPVLRGIFPGQVGQCLTEREAEAVAGVLVRALETAAGLAEDRQLLTALWTQECGSVPPNLPGPWALSFSGGVADCMEKEMDWQRFGDIGVVLGRALRQSRLCAGVYRLGEETIRATVIGAGCHSMRLSGSTVYYREAALPIKNRPVVWLTARERGSSEAERLLRQRLAAQDTEAVLFLPGLAAADYGALRALSGVIVRGFGDRPVTVAVEADCAKALGQLLALAGGRQVLCVDRVRLPEGSYLDVGLPVGPALPVVIKTLVLER